MAGKFGKLPMPGKEEPKMEMEMSDGGGDELFAEAPEEEMPEEEKSPLADISDDELMAEVKRRGLEVGGGEEMTMA